MRSEPRWQKGHVALVVEDSGASENKRKKSHHSFLLQNCSDLFDACPIDTKIRFTEARGGTNVEYFLFRIKVKFHIIHKANNFADEFRIQIRIGCFDDLHPVHRDEEFFDHFNVGL